MSGLGDEARLRWFGDGPRRNNEDTGGRMPRMAPPGRRPTEEVYGRREEDAEEWVGWRQSPW